MFPLFFIWDNFSILNLLKKSFVPFVLFVDKKFLFQITYLLLPPHKPTKPDWMASKYESLH